MRQKIYILNFYKFLDLSCTNDSDCFYNKCIVFFKDDLSIIHYDYVHKGFAVLQNTELLCGKAYDNICKHNYEFLSEYTSIHKDLETCILYLIIIYLFLIVCCICIGVCISKLTIKSNSNLTMGNKIKNYRLKY
ncbi:hypothetical protein H8356DRAFT_1354931 [Neocallimastix lanati (nom. inval.)]|nr:hypothetical protein H8356DRAFT_1354931 [Neocallimastix sp. JGI-2020a]